MRKANSARITLTWESKTPKSWLSTTNYTCPAVSDFDTELMMPDNTRFTLLDHVCVNCPDTPTVMFTAGRKVSGAFGMTNVLNPFAHK
jgi:hypothetical protein